MALFRTKGLGAIKERYLYKRQNVYGFEYAYKDVCFRNIDERFTVAYCMWLNGYVYYFGDFEGTTWFGKK